jgi:hypothetical protein
MMSMAVPMLGFLLHASPVTTPLLPGTTAASTRCPSGGTGRAGLRANTTFGRLAARESALVPAIWTGIQALAAGKTDPPKRATDAATTYGLRGIATGGAGGSSAARLAGRTTGLALAATATGVSGRTTVIATDLFGCRVATDLVCAPASVAVGARRAGGDAGAIDALLVRRTTAVAASRRLSGTGGAALSRCDADLLRLTAGAIAADGGHAVAAGLCAVRTVTGRARRTAAAEGTIGKVHAHPVTAGKTGAIADVLGPCRTWGASDESGDEEGGSGQHATA